MENKFARLVISICVCLLAGYIGSLYVIPAIPSWYASLQKPDFTPPDSLLVPIGVVVYLLLGFALYFIWQADPKKKDTKICLHLFIVGLILNMLWVYVFFGLRSPFMALIIMIMLLAIIVSIIFQSFRVSILACLMLVPYLIIALIAAYANLLIFFWNPNIPLLVM